MGGGTSVVSNAKYPPNGTLPGVVHTHAEAAPQGGEGLLTRQMLDNLARKSFSPTKGRSTRTASSSGFSKSHFETGGNGAGGDSPRPEIPQKVSKLLNRIGITPDPSAGAGAGGGGDAEVDFPEQKSKLVAHIFECLGALQSLVNVADLAFDPELETQSVCERDTSSMGTLLHEMVSIYGVCGDTIGTLLVSNPAAAAVEDSIGRLPLHVAVDCDQPWLSTVATLVEAYPRACRERDGAGRLPLHVVVDRNRPCASTMHILLNSYPEAAGSRRGVGRLAIHYACFCENPSLAIIDILLEVIYNFSFR
jgi:hypothetical protein